MAIPTRAYPAKILISGEYTVVAGSKALAIPFPGYEAFWTLRPEEASRHPWLAEFTSFLEKINPDLHPLHNLDMDRWKSDLARGIFLESNIPVGKGMGSSGALVAAIFHEYKRNQTACASIELIQQDLARIESFFHGSSSGLDPLVSYYKNAIRVQKNGSPELVAGPSSHTPLVICLWDSGGSRETKPLVRHFQELYEKEKFRNLLEVEYLPFVDMQIQSYLESDVELLYHSQLQISKFQWLYFQPMITQTTRLHWLEGLQHRNFLFKLCGAGGGGFYLVFFRNEDAFQEFNARPEEEGRLLRIH